MLGGYGADAQGGRVGPAAAAAAKTWALGVPLGVAIRSIGRGYVPAMSFIGISLAVTGVLMVGWRAALAAVTPEVGRPGRGEGRALLAQGTWALTGLAPAYGGLCTRGLFALLD